MFARRSRTAIAALSGAALMLTVLTSVPAHADTQLPTPLHVNFQLQTTVTPAGYLADFGQAYDATRGYGWVAQSGGAPLDLTPNGRERNVDSDKRLDTFVMPQSKNGVLTVGAWKANVPNGTYNLTIGAGDPSYTDSVDVINVEGVNIVNFTPTTAVPQTAATGTVTVSDGVLNVDEVGGSNTKIDYIDAIPTGSGTTTTTTQPTTTTTTQPGNPSGTTAHYEFGAATTTPVAGYTLDDGIAFNGTYGWENLYTGAPLSYVGTGRDRGVNPNKLLDRLMQPQLAGSSSGNHTYGKWEAVVANGTYNVTVGVGDPSYTDSHDIWNAEGTKIVDFTPTVGTPQTVVTASVTVTDGRLTLDPNNGTNSKIDYVDIVPSGTTTPPPNDTTAPTVSVAVNGSTNTSGAYLDTATVAVTATDAGSGVKSINYTLDGGASTLYTKPVQVNSTGSHTFVVTATDNSNNTSTAITKTFSIVSSTGGGTKATSLVVTSPDDSLGLGSRLVFSTVYNEPRAGQNLTLSNKGTTTLSVTGLAVTAGFQLCSGQATSFTIAPGAKPTVCVQYRDTVDAAAQGTQVDQGTLTITSNDATLPNYVVGLGGLDSQNYGSYHEPSLQQIFDALGYTDNVVVTNKPQGNSISASDSPVGDEVTAPYYKPLNSASPVRLITLAHYSGQDNNPSAPFAWYSYGSTTKHTLYNNVGGSSGTNDGYGQNQLLLPAEGTCSGCANTDSFSPGGSFGLVDNYDGGYVSYSDDALNASHWHNLRAYPAKDANGTVIPGEYLVGDDVGPPTNNPAKNWDYQDFAFLLINATPDTSKSQPAPGVENKTLSGFNGSNGGFDGTGFTSTQGASNTSLISTSGGNLQLTTSGSDSNTSHVNALQFGVESGDKFTITSRLVGPFDAINAGEEQQGIFWGPDATHYAKAEVESQNGVRHVTFYIQNGSSGTYQTVVLPDATGTNNASTVDLRINVDPSPQDYTNYPNPEVSVSYAVNGSSTFTQVGNIVQVPDSFATANTPAGVMISDQNGGSPFTATYNSFSVVRNF